MARWSTPSGLQVPEFSSSSFHLSAPSPSMLPISTLVQTSLATDSDKSWIVEVDVVLANVDRLRLVIVGQTEPRRGLVVLEVDDVSKEAVRNVNVAITGRKSHKQ